MRKLHHINEMSVPFGVKLIIHDLLLLDIFFHSHTLVNRPMLRACTTTKQ